MQFVGVNFWFPDGSSGQLLYEHKHMPIFALSLDWVPRDELIVAFLPARNVQGKNMALYYGNRTQYPQSICYLGIRRQPSRSSTLFGSLTVEERKAMCTYYWKSRLAQSKKFLWDEDLVRDFPWCRTDEVGLATEMRMIKNDLMYMRENLHPEYKFHPLSENMRISVETGCVCPLYSDCRRRRMVRSPLNHRVLIPNPEDELTNNDHIIAPRLINRPYRNEFVETVFIINTFLGYHLPSDMFNEIADVLLREKYPNFIVVEVQTHLEPKIICNLIQHEIQQYVSYPGAPDFTIVPNYFSHRDWIGDICPKAFENVHNALTDTRDIKPADIKFSLIAREWARSNEYLGLKEMFETEEDSVDVQYAAKFILQYMDHELWDWI